MSDVVIDRPSAEDHEALAALFHEDMTLLGIRSTMEDKRRMATGVLWELERDAPEIVCWVARKGPGEPPVGLMSATMRVPDQVPSVAQSSRPLIPSSAAKASWPFRLT